MLVSTGNAVQGRLGELRHVVSTEFRDTDERERQARLALDHLEASLVRQIFEWEGRGHA
ncbi:F0F1 ATP synthase subunit epsilon [compost metagenome]